MTAVEFWEDFYAGRRNRWSGNPNELLVAEVADLPAGDALDLGCGEGGDAIWLAQRGWRVTAVDVSGAALACAAEQAAAAGVGDMIRWERHDLGATFPAGDFDLVTSCYLHSPVELDRTKILRSAATAVRPGGLLVIIGHVMPPSGDPHGHDHRHAAVLPSAAEVLADLGLGDGWDVERCDDIERVVGDPDSAPATRLDSVVRACRHAVSTPPWTYPSTG